MEPNLSLAYVLIGAGFLLMVAELFVPSGGVLSILSACGILAGIVMAFFHNLSTGLWTLLGVCVALPIVGRLLLHYWPKTPMGRRFFLTAPDEHATVASLPENLEMEGLRGQWVRCVEVKAGKVVVRPVEKPTLNDLEAADFG